MVQQHDTRSMYAMKAAMKAEKKAVEQPYFLRCISNEKERSGSQSQED